MPPNASRSLLKTNAAKNRPPPTASSYPYVQTLPKAIYLEGKSENENASRTLPPKKLPFPLVLPPHSHRYGAVLIGRKYPNNP